MNTRVQTAKAPQSATSDGGGTRNAILEATFRQVVSGGYAKLNVRDIAREAGITHALINYHFRNKQQLVLEVLDRANRQLLERQERMYSQPTADSVKWQMACEFYDEDVRSGFIKLMMELMAASFSDPVLRSDFLPRFLAWRRIVDAAAVEAVDRNQLKLPIPPRALGTIIGCFWIGMEAEMALGIPEEEGHHREALAVVLDLLTMIETRRPINARKPRKPRKPANPETHGQPDKPGKLRKPHRRPRRGQEALANENRRPATPRASPADCRRATGCGEHCLRRIRSKRGHQTRKGTSARTGNVTWFGVFGNAWTRGSASYPSTRSLRPAHGKRRSRTCRRTFA